MTTKQDPEETVDPTPDNDSVTDSDDQQSAEDTQTTGDDVTIDWEERYKGLQSVTEKKRIAADKEINQLQIKLTAATEELEEKGTDNSTLQQAQEDAQKERDDLQSQLDNATQERDKLTAQLDRQNIVLKEHPSLAPLTKFIPAGETVDEYRENLDEFSEALDSFVKSGVVEIVSGASASLTEDEVMASQAEEDALWEEVYKKAGVVGMEEEYEEARVKLTKLLDNKNTTT